jgi:hypothetical protein
VPCERRDSARVQESRNLLKIRGLKLRKDNTFKHISETQVESSQRRRNAKAKPVGTKNSSKSGKKALEARGGTATSGSTVKRSAPLDFHVQDKAVGADGFLKRKRIDDLRSSWRIAKSRRPLDLRGAARELTRRCAKRSSHRISFGV